MTGRRRGEVEGAGTMVVGGEIVGGVSEAFCEELSKVLGKGGGRE